MNNKKLFWIFAILTLLLTVTSASADLETDTNHYYSFDNNDTIGGSLLDRVGNDDFDISGATTGQTGIIKQAYTFDGSNDFLNTTSGNSFTTEDISVSFWFKPSTTVTAGSGRDALIREAGNIFIELDQAGNGELSFLLYDTGGSFERIYSSTSTWNAGEWYHIVTVYDGSNMLIYVNGTVETNTSGFSFTNGRDNFDLYVGSNGGSSNFYAGEIDEIGWFNTNLNSSDVQELYNSGSALQYPYTGGDPNVTEPTFSPAAPGSNDVITASVDYEELETGADANITFEWRKNGVSIQNDTSLNVANGTDDITQTLDCAAESCVKDDVINVTVTATIPAGESDTESNTITIVGKTSLSAIQFNNNSPNQAINLTANSTYTHDDSLTGNVTVTFRKNAVFVKNNTFTNVADGETVQWWFDCPTQTCTDADIITANFTAVSNTDSVTLQDSVTIEDKGTITVTAKDVFGNSLDVFNISSPTTASTTNGSIFVSGLDVGSVTVTGQATNFTNTITNNTETVVFNSTVPVVLDGFRTTTLSINLSEKISGIFVNNFTANVTQGNTVNRKSTTNGTLVFDLIAQPANLKITDAEGYAIFFSNGSFIVDDTFTPVNTTESRSYETWSYNTVNITVSDVDTNNLITSNNTVIFRNGPQDYDFTFDGGIFNQSDILTGTYDITASNTNYSDSFTRVTVINRSFTQIDMWLQAFTNSVTFTVTDGVGNAVENAVLTFSTSLNGTQTQIGTIITDFSGQAQINLDPNKKYTVVVQANPGQVQGETVFFETQEITVKPIDTEYQVNLALAGSQKYESVFDKVSYNVRFGPDSTFTNASLNFTVVSGDGTLSSYGFNFTYDSTDYSQEATSPTGSVLTQEFPINPNIESVNVTFHITNLNGTKANWTTPFTLTNASQYTLATGLFPSEADDLGIGGLALFAYGFIVLFIVGGVLTTGSLTAGLIAGMLPLGYFSWPTVGYLTPGVSIATLIAMVVVIIADNTLF